MNLAPFLLLGLALIPLSFDIWLVYGTFCELTQPSDTVSQLGEKQDPITGYWILGNVVHGIGTVLLLGAYSRFFDNEKSQAPKTGLSPFTLLVPANRTTTELLQPVFAMVALYQMPFIAMYGYFWNAPNRSFIAILGSLVCFVFLSVLVAKNFLKQSVLGDLRLELDDAPEMPAHRLSGRVILSRQSDLPLTPLNLQLKLYENRKRPLQENPFGNVDSSDNRIMPELYWKILFASASGIENPFERETVFPFEANIPAWLPRPWTRTKGPETIGIEWNLEVAGHFAGTRVATVFPLAEVPNSLQQPQDKRIRIPQEELAPLLLEQSLLWIRSSDNRRFTLERKRPPLVETIAFSLFFFLVWIGCSVQLLRNFDLFFAWGACASLVMVFAILHKQFVRNRFTFDSNAGLFVYDKMRFGIKGRTVIPKDEFARVFVEPIRTGFYEGDYSRFEYDIFLLFRRNNDERFRVATIKYRLIAKALGQAIATELEVPMEYRAANSKVR